MENETVANECVSVTDPGCVKDGLAVEDVNMNNSTEEIVVEYNHEDYAHLIGDGFSLSKTEEKAPEPIRKAKKKTSKSLQRRPGSMPPFGLFTQENRAKLQKENPELKFGDLGRKLGEMWKAFGEEEKEGYRSRAKEISDRRFIGWRKSDEKRRQEEHKNAKLQTVISTKKINPNCNLKLFAPQVSITSSNTDGSQARGLVSQELELNLPRGITVSRVEPDAVNMPRGITVSRANPDIEILGERTTRKSETGGRALGKNLGVGCGRAVLNSQVAGQQFGKSWTTRGGGVQGNAIGTLLL